MVNFDVNIGQDITVFDPELSYELTGYRPITDTKGLDFKVDEFIEVGQTKKLSGMYTKFAFGTKSYINFWNDQLDKCVNGYTNKEGYKITGDHYFFLNFFPIISPIEKEDVVHGFPAFMDIQYRWFHYVEIAEKLFLDACAVKTRGCGFSEIGGSLGAQLFVTGLRKRMIYAASDNGYLIGANAILGKFNSCIQFLNSETDRGLRRLSQVTDRQTEKVSSRNQMVDGQKAEKGRMNIINVKVVDDPGKLRGARCNRLIFEEAGHFPHLKKAYVQAEALVIRQNIRCGIRILFGTGGSKGAQSAGLEGLYYRPIENNILGYKHSNSSSGNVVVTGFFVGSHESDLRFLDSRGYVNRTKARNAQIAKRDKFTSEQGLKDYSAEYPFNAEEAFSLKNINRFNTDLLSEQKVRLVDQKVRKPLEQGDLEFEYTRDSNDKEVISGVKFIRKRTGKVFIAEHPVKIGGKIPNKLYIGGVDPIDMGQEDSAGGARGSDFCILIKQRNYKEGGQQYVAYYKDRPIKIEDANEVTLKLCMYYNSTINVERLKMASLKSYFTMKKKLHLISSCPRALLTSNSKERPDAKGSPSSVNAVTYGLGLVKDYIENYHTGILLVPLLDQLLTYNYAQKTQFDFVAAMQMTELLDEDLFDMVPDTSLFGSRGSFKHFGYSVNDKGVKVFSMGNKKINARARHSMFNLHKF